MQANRNATATPHPMSVHIMLAGQLAAEVDGIRADARQLRGTRPALAFAYLVAERNRPVPREELADVVWDGVPPATWRPALRGVVSTVRGFLGTLGLPAAEVLTSASGCYQLALPADTVVDVEVVAGEVEIARRALQANDLARARRHGDLACEIARRTFLPGHSGAWVEARRAALRLLLASSLEMVVDVHLATGHEAQAIAPATELVSLDPFRDSAHERLLRAHFGAGGRGEALRAFEQYRRLLADELGVGPAPEVQATYARLLHDVSAARPGHAVAEPLPSTAGTAVDAFVGRRRELDRLLGAWLAAQGGRRRTVLVAGEAGIGKTRLVAEFAALVERAGATVLTGRCDHHLSVPYLPLREALGRRLAAVPPEQLHTLLGDRGADLARFWPELAWRQPAPQPVAPPRPGGDHHLLSEAILVVLEALAASGPVLLAVDDVHGADEASLLLLRNLASARRPANLMTVLTYRQDGPATSGDAVLGGLLHAPGAELVTLDGLTVEAVTAMLSAARGGPLGPGGTALARVLRERTAGNPFFVRELLQHLSRTGALGQGDLTDVAAGPAVDDVPERLHWVIAQRLAELGATAEQVIAAVAVIGRQPELELLARVTDLDREDLASLLDVAVAARMLEERPGEPRRWAFRHALVRDLVYRGLPADGRARIHRRVGEVLEGLTGNGSRLADLADHFALAGDGLADRASRYARRAGEQAFAEHLYGEAARRFRQALSTLDRAGGADADLRGRCDLLLRLGQAWTAAGEAGQAREAYLRAADVARASGSPGGLAEAALGLGGPAAFWSTELDRDGAVQLLRDALAAADPRDASTHARLVARLAGWQAVSALLEPEGAWVAPAPAVRERTRPSRDTAARASQAPPRTRRNESFPDAIAMARRSGDRTALAAVLADQELMWNGMVRPGGPRAALASTAELDSLAVQLGDESLAYRASLARAGALLAVGDLEAVDRLADRERRIAEDRHIPHHRWLSVVLSGTRAMVVGDFETGERLVEEALEVGRGPLGAAATLASGAQRVFLRWLQGRPDEVEAVLERLIAEQLPGARAWPRLLPLAYAGQRRDASVRHHLEAALAQGLAGRSMAELVALVCACVQLGAAAAADRLYGLLAPWSDHHLSAGHIYLGAADHHLALLAATAGRRRAGLQHFRIAAAAHRRLGARPWQALTAHAHAAALRDHGSADDRRMAADMEAAAHATARILRMALPGRTGTHPNGVMRSSADRAR